MSDAATCPAIVLMYHRVAEISVDPFALCVSPRNFEAHLAVLERCARVNTLSDAANVDATNHATAAAPRVAITFDDGYADNFLTAYPILRRYRAPATIFVVAGDAPETREFWWDELERLLLHERVLPPDLTIMLGNREYFWRIDSYGGAAVADFAAFRNWDANPKGRCRLYTELWALLHGLDAAGREQVLAQLVHWAGDDRGPRDTHRRASIEEMRVAANDDLIDIGGHTCTHSSLARLTRASQLREIEGCKVWLEQTLRRTVENFSYPFGHEVDLGPDTEQVVRESGYRAACVNVPGHINFTTNRFRLPRYYVTDLDGPAFEVWLDEIVAGQGRETRNRLAALDAEIAHLRHSAAWYEQQARNWEEIAREREHLLEQQRAWTAELQAGKDWLEGEWRKLKAISEHKEPTS